MIRGKKLNLEVEISYDGETWKSWPDPDGGQKKAVEPVFMHTMREAEMATDALGNRTCYVYKECDRPDGLETPPPWFRVLGRTEDGRMYTRARYRRDQKSGDYTCVAGPEIISA